MISLEEASTSLREALRDAGRGLVEREALLDMVALSAVAGEHLLVLGPPGTAKSEAVRRVARALGAHYFEYLLGRFTEPSEIFGPIDLRKLKEGTVETEITGMLPEAEVAFLDEIFLGSTAILNTLLGILNERRFQRGHTRIECPLRICVAASNQLPEDDSLAALADRFLTRVFLDPIPDSQLEELLEGGWSLASVRPVKATTIAHLDRLAQTARAADLAPLRSRIAQAVRLLRGAGIAITDRRVVKVQSLVAAAAALAGRVTPGAADLWPIIYAVPTADGQRLARDVLRELLEPSENAALPVAAAEASLGPAARAGRIISAARELLAERPPDAEAPVLAAWRLRVEGVAREIDATFGGADLPTELGALRAQIVEAVGDGA